MPNGRLPEERAVERLAKKIYDESRSGTLPWLRLGWGARVGWLNEARASLATARSPLDWLYFWRPARSAAQLIQPKGDRHGKGTTTLQSRS